MLYSLPFDQLDKSLLIGMNQLLAGTDIKLKILHQIGENHVIRGAPVFFALVSVYFIGNSSAARSRILVGLLASCVATAISVSVQEHWTPHLRPVLDTSLPLHLVSQEHIADWEGRLGSFPSDTGVLYLSLCTIVFLERRLVGILCLFWALITVVIARIGLGWHYPSDLAGAMILGPSVVFLFSRFGWLARASEGLLRRFENREYIVHSVYFLLLADAYHLFPALQGLYRIAKKVAVFAIP